MDTNSGHENPETNLGQLFDPEDYLFFYEEGLGGQQAEQEVAFIVRELNLSQPKRVLDAGCGYGRHANRLAALGHQVTGVDAALGMLNCARQDARDRAVSVRYLCENLLELETTESFDCVISMSGSFGFGSDPENARILENFHRAIVAGGQLLLDLPGREPNGRSPIRCACTRRQNCATCLRAPASVSSGGSDIMTAGLLT